MTRSVSCIMLAQQGRDQYLKRAIRMFAYQNHKNRSHELVIVHSESLEYHEYVVGMVTGMKVKVFNCTGSLGYKRNYGVSMASNDLIAVWDDDDIHFPHRLEKQTRLLVNDKSFTAESTYLHVFENSKNAYPIRKDTTGVADRPWQIVQSSLMVPKALFESVGGYSDKSVGEDTDLIDKLWGTGTYRPSTNHPLIVFGYVCTGSGMMSVRHHQDIVSESTKLTLQSIINDPIDHLVCNELNMYRFNTSDGVFILNDDTFYPYN